MDVVTMLTVAMLLLTSVSQAQQPSAAPQCGAAGPLVRIAELHEGSGVAASRLLPGRLYAHNDSGEAMLHALDAQGRTIGRIQISGAEVEDWEAVAVGPCDSGSCIYIGDIGDNDAERRVITIYRVPEPRDPNGAVGPAAAFHARYPDGPRDAEALLVTPSADVLIVTKGRTGPAAMYRMPGNTVPGTTVVLEPIARQPRARRLRSDERITDGTVSPDGQLVALRTTHALSFYRIADLLAGSWRELQHLPLDGLREPQGEGLTFADESTLVLVGEGGGGSRPGTFVRLRCAP